MCKSLTVRVLQRPFHIQKCSLLHKFLNLVEYPEPLRERTLLRRLFSDLFKELQHTHTYSSQTFHLNEGLKIPLGIWGMGVRVKQADTPWPVPVGGPWPQPPRASLTPHRVCFWPRPRRRRARPPRPPTPLPRSPESPWPLQQRCNLVMSVNPLPLIIHNKLVTDVGALGLCGPPVP